MCVWRRVRFVFVASDRPRKSSSEKMLVLLLLFAAVGTGSGMSSSCYRTSNYFRTHFNDTSNVLEQPAPGKFRSSFRISLDIEPVARHPSNAHTASICWLARAQLSIYPRTASRSNTINSFDTAKSAAWGKGSRG